jgi:DNA-binding transcriptional MerR regulator
MSDLINHPPRYTASDIEPIDVIEAWKLGFHLGNTVKYIARAEHKGSSVQDLEKAMWYLNREILRRKKAESRKPKAESNIIPFWS